MSEQINFKLTGDFVDNITPKLNTLESTANRSLSNVGNKIRANISDPLTESTLRVTRLNHALNSVGSNVSLATLSHTITNITHTFSRLIPQLSNEINEFGQNLHTALRIVDALRKTHLFSSASGLGHTATNAAANYAMISAGSRAIGNDVNTKLYHGWSSVTGALAAAYPNNQIYRNYRAIEKVFEHGIAAHPSLLNTPFIARTNKILTTGNTFSNGISPANLALEAKRYDPKNIQKALDQLYLGTNNNIRKGISTTAGTTAAASGIALGASTVGIIAAIVGLEYAISALTKHIENISKNKHDSISSSDDTRNSLAKYLYNDQLNVNEANRINQFELQTRTGQESLLTKSRNRIDRLSLDRDNLKSAATNVLDLSNIFADLRTSFSNNKGRTDFGFKFNKSTLSDLQFKYNRDTNAIKFVGTPVSTDQNPVIAKANSYVDQINAFLNSDTFSTLPLKIRDKIVSSLVNDNNVISYKSQDITEKISNILLAELDALDTRIKSESNIKDKFQNIYDSAQSRSNEYREFKQAKSDLVKNTRIKDELEYEQSYLIDKNKKSNGFMSLLSAFSNSVLNVKGRLNDSLTNVGGTAGYMQQINGVDQVVVSINQVVSHVLVEVSATNAELSEINDKLTDINSAIKNNNSVIARYS